MITVTRSETLTLQWDSVRVAALMDEHDIVTREELAARVGISRATLYRTFDADWCGEVSTRVLIAMCQSFGVLIGRLVHEPRGRR